MDKYAWLDEYLLSKPGAVKDFKPEWGWFRYRVGEKLFAATCCPGPEHPAYGGRQLLTLKCDPLRAAALREEYNEIIPGFYMDKRNWNSVYLDGNLPDSLLRGLCDLSFELVFSKLTKTLQRQILSGTDADA